MRVKLSSLPSQAKTHCVDLERLDGGLNLFEEESRLGVNQSPLMKNLIWRDGALASRRGQRLVCRPGGAGLAAYEHYFGGRAIFHIGSCLYAIDPATGDTLCLRTELETVAGSFFRYGDKLYYKTRGAYLAISSGLECADVEPYTPVTYINTAPKTGVGEAYQSENRFSGRRTVWFTADGGNLYRLPERWGSIVSITVDGEEAECSYNPALGLITFTQPPTVADPPESNTVRVTYEMENTSNYRSIMNCRFAEVHGGDGMMSVVLAGADGQADAFIWSGGQGEMDPGYFPVENRNHVGDEISGFGRQQGMLVVFGRGSVGRADFVLQKTEGREFIRMPYSAINSAIGCDMPGSIRLVGNNLLFCNSRSGVYRVEKTTSAYENDLRHMSRNIDGTARCPGLLQDAASGSCAAMDDGSRYWLAVGSNVYLWDYSVSSYDKPSWFFFTNVEAAAFVRAGEDVCYLTPDGRVCSFCEDFSDFGGPIEREYIFPPQSFGGYERLKDVDKVLLSVSSSTDSLLRLEYISDYGRREEPVPISVVSRTAAESGEPLRWARSYVRKPGCRHVRNFSMRLYNNEAGQDLTLLSARIFYRYRALER